jgi:hypothetical protein
MRVSFRPGSSAVGRLGQLTLLPSRRKQKVTRENDSVESSCIVFPALLVDSALFVSMIQAARLYSAHPHPNTGTALSNKSVKALSIAIWLNWFMRRIHLGLHVS